MADINNAKKNASFCKELMCRLADDINAIDDTKCSKWNIPNHTPLQDDVKRIRRELSKLYKDLESDI